ncbi:hypothetical protein FOL47_007777 [Perkinsus chesapeaki]|uniref:Uncharacterized protein n=1 Tax=Perkinsus chesapeaki TaxID=330153 RepID=A0A7J6LI44_PERCH|nr:hypothetical protein FOL47_007777 [Perkinsus chesapeaki]
MHLAAIALSFIASIALQGCGPSKSTPKTTAAPTATKAANSTTTSSTTTTSTTHTTTTSRRTTRPPTTTSTTTTRRTTRPPTTTSTTTTTRRTTRPPTTTSTTTTTRRTTRPPTTTSTADTTETPTTQTVSAPSVWPTTIPDLTTIPLPDNVDERLQHDFDRIPELADRLKATLEEASRLGGAGEIPDVVKNQIDNAFQMAHELDFDVNDASERMEGPGSGISFPSYEHVSKAFPQTQFDVGVHPSINLKPLSRSDFPSYREVSEELHGARSGWPSAGLGLYPHRNLRGSRQ